MNPVLREPLVEEALLAITISILERVQPINQRRLAGSGGGASAGGAVHVDSRVRSGLDVLASSCQGSRGTYVTLVHGIVAESTRLGLVIVGTGDDRAETTTSTNTCGARKTSGGTSGLGVRSKATALARFAKATRLLVAGARRAGVGATAVLVAKTMATLSSSGSASGTNSGTTKNTLSGTTHSVTFTVRVKAGSLTAMGKILSIVVTVAVEVHALISIQLLPLQFLPVRLGATLELGQLLSCLLRKSTSFTGELIQGLHREDGSSMVHGGSMVSLMDRDSRVDDMRLDGLLLDDRLNMFVNMVMNTLASDNRSSRGRVGGAVSLAGVSELGSLAVEGGTGLLLVAMVESLVLDRDEVVVVLLGTRGVSSRSYTGAIENLQSLLVSNGLNGCVMVLLVNLLVEGSSHLLMSVRTNMLLGDMRPDILVNSGLVLSIVGEEARDGLLCLFHFEFV